MTFTVPDEIRKVIIPAKEEEPKTLGEICYCGFYPHSKWYAAPQVKWESAARAVEAEVRRRMRVDAKELEEIAEVGQDVISRRLNDPTLGIALRWEQLTPYQREACKDSVRAVLAIVGIEIQE
jgi:hypothetical protein